MVVFKATDEGFIKSGERISYQNQVLYKAFEEKLIDPASSEIAKVWQPKAKSVEAFSMDMYKYIENLIGSLGKVQCISRQ